MKIGIITLVGNNYGNRLQNYAVQELLRDYGDVYTVKSEKKAVLPPQIGMLFKLNPAYAKKALDSRLLNIYHLSNRRMNTFSRAAYFLRHRTELKNASVRRDWAFRRFDEQYITFEPELLHLTGDDEEPWVKNYDAWVCGSDQIWNPRYPTATRNAFLQFAQPGRRISFAASIGLSDTKDMLPEYPAWISGIDYISVREEKAAEIVEELTGRKAEVLLDPTMLIDRKKWDDMADASEAKLPKKYAVGYFLGVREKTYMEYINRICRERGLEYVDLLNGEATEYLSFGPDDVVKAIRGAEFCFVDSFHGAVFSILYRKPFVVFERNEEGSSMNSRLVTILNKFQLQDRVFSTDKNDPLDAAINYDNAVGILAQERAKAQSFLNGAIEDVRRLPKNDVVPMVRHIHITRKAKCTGCTACSQVCPKNCISMEPDEEGFVYPSVDTSVCIKCGRCVQVCPVLHHDGGEKPQTVLAEKNRDEVQRFTSSSGGVFPTLAAEIVAQGGVVYGCAMNNEIVANHIRVDKVEELERLKSSKYVQSDMANTMKHVKDDLLNGKTVLFSGTPCQTCGLRRYLGREYENLFVVDVLCHGVPSPGLFRDYLHYLSEHYGNGKPVSVNFRCKQRGWKRLYMEVKFDNGKRHYIYSGYDRYEGLFLNNMSLRPSCYECKFTKEERFGDITLGDFWGIGKKDPQWDDDKGISLVMLNTLKGEQLWQQVSDNFEGREETMELAKAGQRTLYAPTQKNPNRDDFYKMYATEGVKKALEKYTYVPRLAKRTYYAIMRWVLDAVRRVLHKGY